MSTLNSHGYSTKMNPKLKNLLANYKPEDRSEITANRNKQTLWTLNTVKRVKLSGNNHEELTDKDKVDVAFTFLAVILFMWAIFNL